jgi:hypothetical protein
MFQTSLRGEFGAHSWPPQSSFVQHKCLMSSASAVPVGGFSTQIETDDVGPNSPARTSTNLQYESLLQSASRAHGVAHPASVQKFVRQPMMPTMHGSPDSIRPGGSPHQKIRGSVPEPLLSMHSVFGQFGLAKQRVWHSPRAHKPEAHSSSSLQRSCGLRDPTLAMLSGRQARAPERAITQLLPSSQSEFEQHARAQRLSMS